MTPLLVMLAGLLLVVLVLLITHEAMSSVWGVAVALVVLLVGGVLSLLGFAALVWRWLT